MSNQTPQATGTARRAPDCVTKVRMGNTILTVSGYFKQSASETAADKMAKVITVESTMRDLPRGGMRLKVVGGKLVLTTFHKFFQQTGIFTLPTSS